MIKKVLAAGLFSAGTLFAVLFSANDASANIGVCKGTTAGSYSYSMANFSGDGSCSSITTYNICGEDRWYGNCCDSQYDTSC